MHESKFVAGSSDFSAECSRDARQKFCRRRQRKFDASAKDRVTELTKEEKENLRAHIQNNLELLSEVVQKENAERQAVKKNLSDFHKAVDEREKFLEAAANKKRAEDLAELDEQIARLKNFIAENA